MDRLHDIARLLISSLALVGGDERKEIRTSGGALDRAIGENLDRFPDWARRELHIADSRVGLQCVELPEILGWAQAAELTSAPNPYYRVIRLQASQRVARVLLKRLRVPEEDARRLGEAIMAAVESQPKEADESSVVVVD